MRPCHRVSRSRSGNGSRAPKLPRNLSSGLARLVEVVLPRPKVAFAYVAVLLILGVTAGSVTAQIKSSQLDATLKARYVQAVDPYRADSPQP
jgi:hypothetical protein